MKKLISIMLIVSSIGVRAQSTITLGWNCGTNFQATSFIISGTTNLLSPFTVMTNISNSLTNTATNFTAQLPIVPGQFWFVCQMSNFWGLSPYSNQAYVPPVASSTGLTISRP